MKAGNPAWISGIQQIRGAGMRIEITVETGDTTVLLLS
jgi:hypothetical protein